MVIKAGGINLPYYSFKEIWTPLKIVGVRLFQESHEKNYWIKIRNKPRKPLFQ